MHRKRNFNFYRNLFNFILWGVLPLVLLGNQNPPPPDDCPNPPCFPPPPPPGLPIDNYVWVLVLMGVFFVGYFHFKKQPTKA